VPGLKRAGLLFEATNPQWITSANANRSLAKDLGLSLNIYGVHNLEEIRHAFTAFERQRLQALVVWVSPLLLLHRRDIMNWASHKLPVIGEGPEWAESGAIVTYSADYIGMWRHAAVQVNKILRGAKPGDLPIEQPTKITLRVNLRSARDLGITIPKTILVQADEVIQ